MSGWLPDSSSRAAHVRTDGSMVRRHPGFVQGYWGVDAGEAALAHAVVVADTRARATAFAAGVITSIRTAQVRVVEVLASACT